MRQNSQITTIKLVVKHQWEQFCLNTSLHGWKYTVLPKTSKSERYVWLVICLASLGISIYLLSGAWLQFQSNPVITVTESTQHPIYKFEFPAVTMCSFNKVSKKAAYEMARKLKTADSENVEMLANRLRLLFHLLENDKYIAPMQDYEDLHRILEANGKTEEEVFKNISPSCSSLIKKCMWNGEDQRCDIMFEQIKTSIGYCCSFNYFALKSTHMGPSSNRLAKKPRRTSSCGYQSGLEVLLDNYPEDYFASYVPSIGFRVQIHNPSHYPDWAGPIVVCEVNSSNFIGINPEIISATKNVQSQDISERKCLLPTEQKLDIFPKYTFTNCLVECKLALNLELCGCVPFYLHNKIGFFGTANVCTLKDIRCIAENEHLLFNKSFMDEKRMEKGGRCNCLTTCQSVKYIAEASKGILDASYCTNPFSVYSGETVENHTVIRVFFNDLLGTRHRKDVLFTWHSLMGYYGGILGLFTGFSFISVVEIIYFSVIRCLTNAERKIVETHHHQPPNKMFIPIWGKGEIQQARAKLN